MISCYLGQDLIPPARRRQVSRPLGPAESGNFTGRIRGARSQEIKSPVVVTKLLPPPPPPSSCPPHEAPTRTKTNPLCQGQITTLFNWRWASLTIGPVVAQWCRCFVCASHHEDAPDNISAAPPRVGLSLDSLEEF